MPVGISSECLQAFFIYKNFIEFSAFSAIIVMSKKSPIYVFIIESKVCDKQFF